MEAHRRRATIVGTALLCSAAPAAAQLDAPPRLNGAEGAFRVDLRSARGLEDGLAGLSSVGGVDVVLAFNERLAFWGRVDVAYGTLDGVPASAALSNPSAGILFGHGRDTWGTLAFTLPVGRVLTDLAYARIVGQRTDLRYPQRFATDVLGVEVTVAHARQVGPGWRVGGRGEVALITQEAFSSEILARASAFAERSLSTLAVGFEARAYGALTEGDAFGENSHLLLSAYGRREGALSPEVYVSLPVDGDARDTHAIVLGARLSIGGGRGPP